MNVEQIAAEAEIKEAPTEEEAKLKIEEEANLKEVVAKLLGTAEEYAKASRMVYERTKLKKKAQGLLLKEREITPDSSLYAGLEKGQGRLSWKTMLYAFAKDNGLEEKAQIFIDNFPIPTSHKVKYGKKGDKNYEKAKQLEFFTEGKI